MKTPTNMAEWLRLHLASEPYAKVEQLPSSSGIFLSVVPCTIPARFQAIKLAKAESHNICMSRMRVRAADWEQRIVPCRQHRDQQKHKPLQTSGPATTWVQQRDI